MKHFNKYKSRVVQLPPLYKEREYNMGYYEEHILSVAKRQALRIRNEKSEKVIFKFLKNAGWEEKEIDIIMEKARQIACKS